MQKEQDYAKTTFDEVALRYDEIEFFKISARHIAKMIQKIPDKENLEILDVACGSGNVVLECASVLKDASFDAFDISEGMLNVAKQNAKKRDLTNINFQIQDITKLSLDKKYDVITCSYALFFLPDAANVLKNLTRLLKDDGRVIFTTFLEKAFSPTVNIFLSLLRKHGSKTALEYDPISWDKLKRVDDIEYLCKQADINRVEIDIKEIRYDLDLDAWWELLNNTGFKGMLMELSLSEYKSVKREYQKEMLKYADKDIKVELIADSFFVSVKNKRV